MEYQSVVLNETLQYSSAGSYKRYAPCNSTYSSTVLREAMQALVRVQAHMLARIVVEIRAADIAVELEPQL